ncbi:hypothetical protein [Luteolibacter luteus]|uniref:Uncharacterized protein n=1 Tax=Luteolibacter luteus TaxID=2728835 RepID=A0A858RFH6_9BACT|nr:hypothetical protein [Luteolibacter luteus]QJE95050.1 hypothetical protein HHL09_04435 [Luteolibacter luteus]
MARLRQKPSTDAEREAFRSSIAALNDEALSALLETINATRKSPQDQDLFIAAITELAKRDPENVLSWFDPTKMERHEPGWAFVAAELGKAHPEILEKWLLGELSKGSPEVLTSCLLGGIEILKSGQGMERAIQFHAKLPKGSVDDSELVNALFMDFDRESPADAEKAARQLFTGGPLNHALYNIAMQASRKDLLEGMACAGKIADTSMRNRVLAMQFRDWFDTKPDLVMEQLGKLDAQSLAGVLKGDPQAPGSDGLVAKLGKADADGLIKMMSSLMVSSSNREVFEKAVNSISHNAPGKALDLIEGLPEGALKGTLYSSYFIRIAAANPATALQTAASLAAGESRSTAYITIGGEIGGRGFEETLRMTQTIPEADRPYFLGGAMPYLANTDPKRALELLKDPSLPITKEIRQDTISRVGGHFYQSDSASAQQWMASLPAEDQPSAMEGIANQMVTSDVEGLAKMLRSIPRNEAWANGVRVLMEDLKSSDPEMAKQWQETLSDAGFGK